MYLLVGIFVIRARENH